MYDTAEGFVVHRSALMTNFNLNWFQAQECILQPIIGLIAGHQGIKLNVPHHSIARPVHLKKFMSQSSNYATKFWIPDNCYACAFKTVSYV